MKITAVQVTFSYSPEVIALRDVSLTIPVGETVAIVGENGAGKSTLAKHLNGLLRPDSGSVAIGDWDTREYSAARLAKRVGFAFQNPNDQLFKRTVRAEIAFGPQNLGFSAQEIDAAVAEALEMTGLTDEAETHPHDLHRSKRRMVALASTLAMRTPIVVIDEPTIGQDAHGIGRIGAIVQRLKNDGRTVIAISHHIDFCVQHFVRFVVMSQGRITADGPAQEIVRQQDLLHRAHVEPPQISRLAAQLNLSGPILDIESFLRSWQEQRTKQ